MSATFFSVSKWSVQTYNTGSSAWATVASWPRGSVNAFSKKYVSTTQVFDLADGSQGMMTPSTKFTYDPMSLSWNKRTVTPTFKSNLENYNENHIGIKISFHDSTTVQGYIMSIEEEYAFSGSTQQYDVVVEFKPFSVDGQAIKT